MLTGKKNAQATDEAKKPVAIRGSKLGLALIVLALCAGTVYTIANGFTDTLPDKEYDLLY